jgi:hypothetical protein
MDERERIGDRDWNQWGQSLGGRRRGTAAPFRVHEQILDDNDEPMSSRGIGPANIVTCITRWIVDMRSEERLVMEMISDRPEDGRQNVRQDKPEEVAASLYPMPSVLTLQPISNEPSLWFVHILLVLFRRPSPPVSVFLRALQPSTVFLLLP